jgi:hypothetical protein
MMSRISMPRKSEKRAQADSRESKPTTARRPISALLPQILVAFTVELDNEFELQMAKAGHPGARLSLVVWLNLMRFIPEHGISVRELVTGSLLEQSQIKFMLGCLERWGFVTLEPGAESAKKGALKLPAKRGFLVRDGFGSGRGISNDWNVRLSDTRGVSARSIWLELPEKIEQRWQARFGSDEIQRLRDSLRSVVDHVDLELPHGFVDVRERRAKVPPRRGHEVSEFPLPTLLAQALILFVIEFEQESSAPLSLCASMLRVLGDAPVRESDIVRLTGSSPETSGIGWQVKPYIVVETDPSAKRGKAIGLSPRGMAAQGVYRQLTAEIEKRWQVRFGMRQIENLRESLLALLNAKKADHPLLSEGLIPPPGTVRAGEQIPALGRRDVGVAARQRARDLATQTEQFVRDPSGALPHYPLWDMNRGFGP